MSAETAIKATIKAATLLYKAVKGVKSNKEKCNYLCEQVRLIVDDIQEKDDSALGQHSGQILNFEVFEECLN